MELEYDEEHVIFKDQLQKILPENLKVGQAIGGGDCFFDAVAQGLKQVIPATEFTIKSLRNVCKDLAIDNQQLKTKVINDARSQIDPSVIHPKLNNDNLINDIQLWHAYLASVEYTSDDIDKLKKEDPKLCESLTSLEYGSTLQVPVWGRPDIEGQMICDQYNVELHAIEKHEIEEKVVYTKTQIVNSKGPLLSNGIVYILNNGNAHFVPLLSNINENIQKAKEVSKEEIYSEEGLSIIEDPRNYASDNVLFDNSQQTVSSHHNTVQEGLMCGNDNRVVLLTWYTDEQLKNNPDTLFLFGDNDKAKYRNTNENPGGGGQARITRGKVAYDRLEKEGGVNGNAIGITTTFYGGYTPNTEEFKILMDKEFAPIETWVTKGGCVVVPCQSSMEHNLGTGIADLKSKIPGAIEYIQSKVNRLDKISKQSVKSLLDLNILKQNLHQSLRSECESYHSLGGLKNYCKNKGETELEYAKDRHFPGEQKVQQSRLSKKEQININNKLFNIIRKEKKSTDEKYKKVKKLICEGAQVNARDANDETNTPLHLAVHEDELKIVQLLLEKSADINIKNNDNNGDTPLELAIRLGNREEIINALNEHVKALELYSQQKEVFYDIKTVNQQQILPSQLEQTVVKRQNTTATYFDVKSDGNCLFWAVTLGYLIPVKDNKVSFIERFNRLFGDQEIEKIERAISLIQNYDLDKSGGGIDNNIELKDLITKKLRERVADEILKNKNNLRDIEIGDFYGVAGKKYLTYEISNEKDKRFGKYLEYIKTEGMWGGDIDIQVISAMLGCSIEVKTDYGNVRVQNYHNGSIVQYGANPIMINLYFRGNGHYNFGLEQSITDNFKPDERKRKGNDQDIEEEPNKKFKTANRKRLDIHESSVHNIGEELNKKLKISESIATNKKRHHKDSNRNIEEELSKKLRISESVDEDESMEVDAKKLSPHIKSLDAHKQSLDELRMPEKGAKLALHGNLFQLKLLMLFLHRAKENKYNSFRLATEMGEAEKFDDVVFQYQTEEGGKWKFRFLQAKHKDNPDKDKIEENELLSTNNDKPFSLQKYFHSYLRIKQRTEEGSIYSVFRDSEIEDVIICTNTDFAEKLKSHFEIKDIKKDKLLRLQNNENPQQREALIYELKDKKNNEIAKKLEPILKETSDFNKLVEELAEHVLEDKQIDKKGFFKEYYYALIREVLDIKSIKKEKKNDKEQHYIRFLPEFLDEKKLSFRNTLIEIISRKTEKNKLLDNGIDLRVLAKELAYSITDFINYEKKLDPSDFDSIDCHIALVNNEVIDVEAGKFCASFLTKKSGLLKNLRDFLKKELDELEMLADSKMKEIKFKVSESFGKSEFSIDKQKLENSIKVLKEKEIKISKGFAETFKPEENPEIKDAKGFAQQVEKLLLSGKNEKIIKVDEYSVEKENFEIFKSNINKLAGYILIERFGKIRFSTSFLYSDKKDHLPGNLKDFKDKLKKRLNEKFESIYEYEFDIKLDKFKTSEEGALYRKLPILHKDSNIEGFFSKLKFVFNYPNHEELNELIEGDIKNILKKLDGEAFKSLYQDKLQDWMADRVGTFYTTDKAKTLFDNIKANLELWTMDGVAKSFFTSVSTEYKFNEYSDFTNFLKSKEQQVLHLICQDLQLCRIRIVQTFKDLQSQDLSELRNYVHGFGHTFLHLNQLSNESFYEEVLQFFQYSNKGNLLVIECNTQPSNQEIEKFGKFKSVLKENKKVIFITQQNENKKEDILGKIFSALKNKYQKLNSTTMFFDLVRPSQQQFLNERKVIFQDAKYEIHLGALVGQNPEKIIDSETLVKLINNETVTIGNELKNLGKISDYYIDRFFFRYIEIKQEIRQDAAEQIFFDVLVISDNEEEFSRLCEQHPQSNIHWLRSKSRKLIWQKSQGSISNLIKYREENKDYNYDGKETGLGEEELVNYDNQRKIVIISDIAGMGKSTVLTNLSTQIKNKFHDLWVVRIDLNDYTTMLKKELDKQNLKQPSFNNDNINEAVNFLLALLESQNQSKLKTYFEKKLFKSSLKERGKIALLFDGFDEISPNYKDIVIDLLQALKKSNIERLFVTTRPHMKEVLEEKLGVFSYTLEEFSKEKQTQFLTKFWKKALGLNDLNQEGKNRLVEYAKTLINKLSESISDREKEFTGIPLQMRMVAEVFQKTDEGKEWEGCKEFLSSINEAPKLPQKLDLLELYEKFFDIKCDIYRNEKGTGNSGNISTDIIYRYFLKYALEYHKQLAVQMLFSKEQVNFLQNQQIRNQDNEKEKEIVKIGIVTQITDNKPHFIHRTFAEYFAADFLASTLAKNEQDEKVQEFLLRDILIKPEYKIIRAFFDSRLGKMESIPENTLTQYGKLVARLWSPDTQQSLRDDHGNTLLHLASVEGNTKIIHFLLYGLKKHSEMTLKDLINAEDRNGNTALYIAAEKGNLEVMQCLVKKGANVDAADKYGNTVLFRAVKRCFHSDLIELLVQKGANVDAKDGRGNYSAGTVLYNAAEEGNLEVVQCLVKKGANVNAADMYGITVLHNAIHSSNLKVVQYLVQKGANVDAKDGDGNTVLHYAAYSGNLELCKWLVQPKADGGGGVNVNAKANDDSTVLHEAAISGNLELCEWLVKQGLSIDAKDEEDRMALHEAAKYDNLEVVQWLVMKGANVIAKTNDGNTVLHEAAKYGNSELCEWLVKQGLSIDAKDNEDRMALHEAAKYGNLEVVQWLVKKGANVDNTVLFEATKYNKDDIVKKWDLQKNSQVYYTINQDGIRRATRFAHDTDKTEQIVQYLIKKCANVNT